MDATEILELITSRRSVRRFSAEPVSPESLEMVLEAGRWAPSGLNNQPWRLVVVDSDDGKAALAPLTRYGAVIKGAALLICVFIHLPSMYNETKDHQAMGACLQNMLLMAHGLGLGAVWLGEILNSADQVRGVVGLSDEHQLMAVLALGHPAGGTGEASRKPLSELVLSARQES
ncbi:MAG: nitroreductase [Desulfarculaceae bacterium]|nr:nitroreductase [Desulfarculaceae bacterium]MCF8072077.1 nitroreductase [Desulfarculaceae bacterium]MCF8101594.1 nitroreductase [Desulfarculaceae bacterium]MCF8115144.1 nitroreductase [Desulfarculaceae bacterium]